MSKVNSRYTLLSALTEDGSGESIKWEGGEASFIVSGGMGGGTCTIEVSSDKVTWVPGASEMYANGMLSVNIAESLFVRATVSNSTGPSITALLWGNHTR